MRKSIIGCTLVASFVLFATPGLAGSCHGYVQGLSDTYNKKTGSGFLAVRQKPTAKSRQVGELFNDQQVDVDRRKGNWIYIYGENVRGWVFQKYVRRGCDGI